VTVAVGLGISGVATYAFFGITSRALSPGDYAAVGVLWSLLFAVGNGVMQPLEQEVARAVAHRRALGIGPGPVIRRAIVIGAAFAAILIGVGLATEPWVLGPLLGDQGGLVAAFLVGLAGFGAAHLTRGTLSSHSRFRAYAAFFGVDGVARVLGAAVLAVIGVAAVGPYGAMLAAAPFIAAGIAVVGRRGLLEAGPPAHWNELTRALGWLLAGTVSLALVVQGGTIAVEILAGPDQQDAAGVFLNGLQVARTPLFLFQAVLASLLPRLSRLLGQGDRHAFVHTLRQLVGAIAVVGAVATVGAVVLGPWVVELLFGSTTVLGPLDLGLLSGAFVLVMVAISLDQALIAMGGHRDMALGWVLALAVFAAVTALGTDLFLRVELGLLASAVVACTWMALRLRSRAGRPDAEPVTLAEALAEAPLQE
jgi:O-antigen/teichoic acid export membrane protein